MRTLQLFVLCLAVAGCATGLGDFFAEDEFESYSSFSNYALQRRGSSSDWDKEAIIVAKMYVPAAMHDDFISEWQKLQDSTQDEKGVVVYDMKKTQTDNSLFLIYGHWKSWNDYMSHLKSSHFQKFQDFIKDEEINVRVVPMKRVASRSEIHEKKSSSSKDLMSVVFSFWVDPKHHKDFIKRWEDLADETSNEKGIRHFALRKSELDNLLFTVYGSWDNVKDFHKHHWSKHASKFREFKAKHNIVWKVWPLEKIGKFPELAGTTEATF